MNSYAALSTLTLCMLFSGCNYSAALIDRELTIEKPNEQDLIGRWMPTKESLKDMRGRGRYPEAKHEVELRTDGTFSMLNMPDWWNSPYGESRKGFDSGSGSWKLAEDSGSWKLRLKFKNEKSARSVDLAKQKAPYLMVFTFGDPDNAYATRFERTGNP